MSIETKDQYYFSFDIGGEEDFLSEDKFKKFKMVEQAGNILPTYELIFESTDPEVMSSFHEGNFFTVKYGGSSRDVSIATLSIVKLERINSGQGQVMFTCLGTTTALPYVDKTQSRILPVKMSGLEAVEYVGGDNFQIDNEEGESKDSQRWIQAGVTDMDFVQNAWLHSNLGDSAPVLGITSTNKMRIRSLSRINDFKWTLGKGGIPILGDISAGHNSGFLNAWFGYGRTGEVIDMEEGTAEKITSTSRAQIAKGEYLRYEGIPPRAIAAGFRSDNVDPDYYRTYLNNMESLIVHSEVKVSCYYVDTFYPMEVLDSALLLDPHTEEKIIKATSGPYVICNVTRTLENRRFKTVLELCRESVL